MAFDFVLTNISKLLISGIFKSETSPNLSRFKEVQDFNNLIECHLDAEWVVDWDATEDGWTFELKGAMLYISHDGIKPVKIIVTRTKINQQNVDQITQWLSRIIEKSPKSIKCLDDVAALLVRAVNDAVTCVKLVQEKTKCTKSLLYQKGWNARKMRSWESRWDNARGVDLSTIDDTATHLLGKSLHDICSEVRKGWRILHVESIFREDLVERFLEKKDHMYQSFLQLDYALLRKSVDLDVVPAGSTNDTLEGLAAALTKPTVAFHGTSSQLVKTIVRYGFVKSGGLVGDAKLPQRMDHASGKGIYSTPNFEVAILYSRPSVLDELVVGRVLIVVAVLLGRPGIISWGDADGQEKPYHEDSDSNFNVAGEEYVVFEEAQIVPCYVIRLDEPEKLIKRSPPKDRFNWNLVDAQKQEIWGTEASTGNGSHRGFGKQGPKDSEKCWLDQYQNYRLTDSPVQLSIDKPVSLFRRGGSL